MRFINGICYLLLCILFSVSLFSGRARALTFLSQDKKVVINPDWGITGNYNFRLGISSSDDIPKINRIVEPFINGRDQSVRVTAEVCLPDGTRSSWQAVSKNNLPAGATVRLAATVTKKFPGFSGLFADNMHINQNDTIKHVSYQIVFPQKTDFVFRVFLNDESQKHKNCADRFSWSGKDINRLRIQVSTAASWEQIRRHYQTHFQKRLGDGLSSSDLPAVFHCLDTVHPPDKTIRDVLTLLNNRIVYRKSPDPAHALFPEGPRHVLQRGWGDCKDLSLLAAALLQKMGVETFVVLTGSPPLHLPAPPLPDPFIFDHALIGFDGNGRTTYYDCLQPDRSVAVNEQYIYLPLKIFGNDKTTARLTR